MNLDVFFSYFSYNSIVILSYFLISLLFLIFNILSKDKINNFLACRRGNLINPMFYIRILLSSFCHQDWNHFKNNFLMILLIGPILEEKYGSMNLLYMLIITSVITGITHIIFYKTGTIGASDNVFMLVVLCSIVNLTTGKIPMTLVLILFFYVADEVFNLFKRKDSISHDSHIVGAICGFIFGYIIFK